MTLTRIAEHFGLTLEAPTYWRRLLRIQGRLLYEGTPSGVWAWLSEVGATDSRANPIQGWDPCAIGVSPPAAFKAQARRPRSERP